KNVMKKPFTYLTKEILDKINESRQLEERIPAALKNGEFLPYYQPKVDIDNMELCGAEALARWEYDNTVVSPAKFIPVMEKDDSICGLDFYILDRVCKDVAGWIDQGLEPPCISVNFSRRNLGNPVLAEEIHNVVVDNNIPEKYIQVEITETIDEYPLSYLKGVVEALQRYGLTVAIDDFGTGSSSINLLREISFDVLKIDRQFIECRSEKEKKLLEHIIDIAHDIDSHVIAEGVEQMDQIKMLKDYGCSQIQGYVFDKPLRKSEFEERMNRKKYG
ncbi:MAG: EAL domain-containing protein, partial [Oscillospiraceae bacterium]